MNARLGMVLSAVVVFGVSTAQGALIDFNGGTNAAGPTQAGWDGFTLPGPSSYDGMTVTVSAVSGADLQGRDRGATNPPNSGGFTLSEMYRDFLYVDSGEGVTITIGNLVAGAQYTGRIWSYDHSQRDATTPANFATDWLVNNVLVADNYSFGGWGLPDDNTDASFTFTTTADDAGQIVITGLKMGGGNGVGINGLQLDLVPEPASVMLVGLGATCLLARRTRA